MLSGVNHVSGGQPSRVYVLEEAQPSVAASVELPKEPEPGPRVPVPALWSGPMGQSLFDLEEIGGAFVYVKRGSDAGKDGA